MSGAVVPMLSLLYQVGPATSRVIATIAPDQWSRSTPCDEMTVNELAAHLVGGLEQFGDVAAGLPVDVTATTDVAPDELSGRFDASAQRMFDGWSATGQDLALDEGMAQSVLDLAESFDDESIRVPGMFAPSVVAPADAPTIDRLAAFLGRDPTKWSV